MAVATMVALGLAFLCFLIDRAILAVVVVTCFRRGVEFEGESRVGLKHLKLTIRPDTRDVSTVVATPEPRPTIAKSRKATTRAT